MVMICSVVSNKHRFSMCCEGDGPLTLLLNVPSVQSQPPDISLERKE